jgi:hypothetical protein
VKNIKKYLLGSMIDLVKDFDRKARNPWITKEMISKIDE